MTSFTAQQKRDLFPLRRRVAEWNNALDEVDPGCVCWNQQDTAGPIPGVPGCPGAPRHCMGVTLIAIRTNMNLVRLANHALSDRELIDAVRALDSVFDGLPAATSHATFANSILIALRQPAHFKEATQP